MADCYALKYQGEKSCCCICRYRLKALQQLSDPSAPDMPERTWACIAFAFMEGKPVAYIGNFEHGMCELFRPLPWPKATSGVKELWSRWCMIRDKREKLILQLYQSDNHVEAEGHRVQLQLIGLMEAFIADLWFLNENQAQTKG